jgi:hypothetical protein
MACSITNSNLISKVLQRFNVYPYERAVEVWIQCLALWSWWAYLCVGHPQWMSDWPWTKYAIQTPMYGSCFLPWMLICSLPGSQSHIFQDLHKIWCTLAVPLSDPLRNRIRPDTWPQLKGCKKISMSNQLCDILCSYSQDILVLLSTFASHLYNCCADGSISPGNYGYQLVFVAEPASCNDSALPPGDRSTPIKPEYYSVLPKHDGESQLPSTAIQPDDLPGKFATTHSWD